MEYSIYDTLLSLPLFQGLSKADFETILDKVKLDFEKTDAGKEFLTAAEACTKFVFLLDGTVSAERISNDGRLSYTEYIEAPALFEPQSMFGSSPVIRRTYTAMTPCSILSFGKHYLYSELLKYNICSMNMLNMLSGRVQNLENGIWNLEGGDMRQRFVKLMKSLSDVQTGRKDVRVKMEVLAEILTETRLSVSRMLNQLDAEGLIKLGRGGFTVPKLESLI